MTEPTPVEYAKFGEAVAGILDTAVAENAPAEFTVTMTQLAARVYGIEPQEHPE